MPNLQSLDNVYLILGFLVPGLIVLFVRAQFMTGRKPPHTAELLSYLTVSVIYYAFALPFVDLVRSIHESGYVKTLSWFALIFIGPAALGLLLGINVQKNLFRRMLQWFRLNPVHGIPTAWDWKFGGMTNQWVLVTLKNGSRIAGFCGQESFMSTDPSERDIYIQWIYDISDENKWSSRGEKGVLITAGEVQTIEFWPATSQENDDGQE